jgi:hypothetical protein
MTNAVQVEELTSRLATVLREDEGTSGSPAVEFRLPRWLRHTLGCICLVVGKLLLGGE